MATKEANGWDYEKELKENEYMGSVQRKIILRLHDPSHKQFALDKAFVRKYSNISPPFGFQGFGEAVFMRTYSRIKDDGYNERWHDTVERVTNGTYNLQKRWIIERGLEWNEYKAQKSAQEMYDRMFRMKFLPPGRGLWAMGSEITEERGLYAALNNCAFVSTENIKDDLSKPFKFLMDISMLGVGVGFDTKGTGKIVIKGPDSRRTPEVFNVPDTREGWVEGTGRLIDSYFLGITPVTFNYDQVRSEGLLIKGFGGKSSGPEPLKEMHSKLEEILRENISRPLTSRTIVDIQNIIGKCVVAGNVRRTAEIAFGNVNDETFLDLKNYEVNPERAPFGWTSNNSVFAELGMNYSEIAKRIRINGEPGLAWLTNMQDFSRMCDPRDGKDSRARGGNPCLEQTLESYELCNLVENFPMNHDSKEDFLRTLKFSYMYAKTVALGETHWEETNRVLLRNRRIGCSVSGVQQFVHKNDLGTLKEWLEEGFETIKRYDDIYSEWMTVPKSIKRTSVKPSGSVSSVAGATSGMHWPISEFYIRRMRLSKQSELLDPLKKAGYYVEDDENDPSSLIVEFPIRMKERGIRMEKDVPMLEQFGMAAFLQKYWADNQVSCTIKFHPGINGKERQELHKLQEKFRNKKRTSKKNLERMTSLLDKESRSEADQIAPALDQFQYQLKGISMLPNKDDVYSQPPFESISEEKYNKMIKDLNPDGIDFSEVRNMKVVVEKFCNTDACEIP